MIAFYQNSYKKLYDTSAKYNVIPINEEHYTYKVYLGEGDDYQHNKSHELNIKNKKCSCGKLQDKDLMCEHLLAYYRVIEKKSLKQILEMPYNPYYSYQYLRSFYKENINPVVIDALSSDKTTQPPPKSTKRQPGRPSTKRKQTRKRSDKTVRCSNCLKTKHNKKRCPKVEGYANLIAQGLIIPDTESEQSDDSSASDKEDRKPKAKRTRTNKKPTERSESSFY